MHEIKPFLTQLIYWAQQQESIQAVALVGSYARGKEKKDSDIDLMIIVKDPQMYIADEKWIYLFGEVEKIQNEVWTQVKTKRVFYKDGLEIEFNFDKDTWVKSRPIDSGTKRVVNDGMQILIDKEGMLEELQKELT